MHATAMANGKKFFDKYCSIGTIVEIGSMESIEPGLRNAAPSACKYIGVDTYAGDGVDIVSDPYSLPFEANSVEVVASSSTFEHVEFFWVLFVEMARIVKPGGFIYINAPSRGPYHKYPVDCWRFYLDAGEALKNWANRNGYTLEIVETYMDDWMSTAGWGDWVCIWRKL